MVVIVYVVGSVVGSIIVIILDSTREWKDLGVELWIMEERMNG